MENSTNNLKADAILVASPDYLQAKILLERYFLEILSFDTNIAEFSPHPCPITYTDRDGQQRVYQPNGLIRFAHEDRNPYMAPILFDIHAWSHGDFRQHRHLFTRQWRAAKTYANRNGWKYVVFTERDVFTPLLSNMRFLRPFTDAMEPIALCERVLEVLDILGEADMALLLCALCHTKRMSAAYIPAIWHLVAIGIIDCALDRPLSMKTVLRRSGVRYD